MTDRILAWLAIHGPFWLSVVAAAIVKAIQSEKVGWRAVMASLMISITLAGIFTRPTMHYFGIDEAYVGAVGGLIAIGGESLTRIAIGLVSDPEIVKSAIRKWVGGGK